LGTRRQIRAIEEDTPAELGYAPIRRARHVANYVVEFEFVDGLKARLDLEPFLRGPIFEPLRNVERFRKFRIERAFGTIAWRNGADIAPETLYEAAQKAAWVASGS